MPQPNEAQTRRDLIDPALELAGWDVQNPAQVGIEIPVDHSDPQVWAETAVQLNVLRERGQTYEVNLPSGIADYVLFHETGEVLAVVEAKKLAESVLKAEAQAEFYVNEISKWPTQTFRPFACMTNGERIRFWDIGQENPRDVAGFFTLEDLRTRLYLRQQKRPLHTAVMKPHIVDRLYQTVAMRNVIERFENDRKRRALLAMATGTGKTRVAMSLIDIFISTKPPARPITSLPPCSTAPFVANCPPLAPPKERGVWPLPLWGR